MCACLVTLQSTQGDVFRWTFPEYFPVRSEFRNFEFRNSGIRGIDYLLGLVHTGNFPPGIFTEHIPEDSFFRYKPAGIIPGGVGTVRHVSVSRNVSNLGKPGTGRRQIGNSKMEVKQQRQHCGTCKKRKPSEIPDHPRPIRGRCPYYEEWQAIKDSRSTRGPSPHPTVVTSMQSAVTGTSPQQQQQQQQQVAQVADPELELPIKVPWEQIGETGMHLNDAHAPA